MKKVGKRIWVWILSGLTMLLGACHFHHRAPECVYGPPTEELYGPPAPKTEVDFPESDTIVEEIEEER